MKNFILFATSLYLQFLICNISSSQNVTPLPHACKGTGHPCKPAGTVKDIDGNVYATVIIGKQEWMAQNLNVTKYRDGIAITKETDDKAWINLKTEAYCRHDSIRGSLYNWYAVNNGGSSKLCPTGWHVPSDAEWTTLTNYLGSDSIAGGKLKECGTTHWASPNTGATNETCFSALPGGFRNWDGWVICINSYGHWWTSTESDANNAWYRDMGLGYSSVYRNDIYKQQGCSVRCLKE